jgi:hypothetical protein
MTPDAVKSGFAANADEGISARNAPNKAFAATVCIWVLQNIIFTFYSPMHRSQEIC